MLYRKFLDMYSRVNKNRKHKLILKMAILGVVTSLMSFMSTTAVNTASMLTVSEVRKAENNIIIQPVSLEFSVPEQNEVEVSEVNHSVDELVNTSEVQSTYVEPVVYQQTQVVLPVASQQVAGSYPAVLSNGNTAGAIGSEAAAQMAAATGVSQATWEYIIARESNGNPNAANASGASGLFQTMPGWGSTATVQDQINAAINAYNNQGLAAWGM